MIILNKLKDEVVLKGVNNALHGSVGSVPDNVLTTILTLTASTLHKIVRISCSGNDYAKFQLYLNTNLIETRRSGPDRTIDFTFVHPLLVNNGDILDIKVTHYFTGELLDYESTIYSII